VLSGEATNTNFIDFALNRSGLEPTIYRTLVPIGVIISYYYTLAYHSTDLIRKRIRSHCLLCRSVTFGFVNKQKWKVITDIKD